MVLRGDWTQLQQILAGRKTFTGALPKFVYISEMLLRSGTRTAQMRLGVENRGQISDFLPLPCKINGWVGEGGPRGSA